MTPGRAGRDDAQMILAGDIGGTHTRLAFFEVAGGRLRPITEATFPSHEHESLEAVVGRFVSSHAVPFAHASFAPDDEIQLRLLDYLRRQYGHVSWERVLSGPGLHNIYLFLRDVGAGAEPPWLRDALREADPSAVISRAALEGRSALCAKALDLFVSLYGAEAGNLALKIMATGGVFLGGGIAPKILPKLHGPAFGEAFAAKGRMRPLLEAIPVRAIINDMTALLGAAHHAALQAGLLREGSTERSLPKEFGFTVDHVVAATRAALEATR